MNKKRMFLLCKFLILLVVVVIMSGCVDINCSDDDDSKCFGSVQIYKSTSDNQFVKDYCKTTLKRDNLCFPKCGESSSCYQLGTTANLEILPCYTDSDCPSEWACYFKEGETVGGDPWKLVPGWRHGMCMFKCNSDNDCPLKDYARCGVYNDHNLCVPKSTYLIKKWVPTGYPATKKPFLHFTFSNPIFIEEGSLNYIAVDEVSNNNGLMSVPVARFHVPDKIIHHSEDDFPDLPMFYLENIKNFPNDEITVSFRMKSDEKDRNAGLFSYAVGNDGSANEFLIHYWGKEATPYPFLLIYVNNKKTNRFYVPNLFDGEWHHLAVSWKKSNGKVKVFYDGIPIQQKNDKRISTGTGISSGGTIVLGEDQDKEYPNGGGGFNFAQSFFGEMDDLRVYSEVLDYNTPLKIIDLPEVRENLFCHAGSYSVPECLNGPCAKMVNTIGVTDPSKNVVWSYKLPEEQNLKNNAEAPSLVMCCGLTQCVKPKGLFDNLGSNIDGGGDSGFDPDNQGNPGIDDNQQGPNNLPPIKEGPNEDGYKGPGGAQPDPVPNGMSGGAVYGGITGGAIGDVLVLDLGEEELKCVNLGNLWGDYICDNDNDWLDCTASIDGQISESGSKICRDDEWQNKCSVNSDCNNNQVCQNQICVSKKLIHHYDLDGNAEDKVGNLDGTVSGATYSAGKGPDNSGAYNFANQNKRIGLAEPGKIGKLALDSGTISVWAKYTGGGGLGPANSYRYIFGRYDNSGKQGSIILRYNGYGNDEDRIKFYIREKDGSWISISSIKPFNEFSKDNNGWHNYVVTWSSEKTQLFIDGELQGESTGTVFPSHASSDLAIGARENKNNGHGWNGYIDKFKIWNYVRSADAVKEDYDHVPRLIHYYDFNDGDAEDKVGNLDGTVKGATYVADRGTDGDGAFRYDGVDDNIKLLDDPSLDVSNGITLMAWVYKDEFTTNHEPILSKTQNNGGFKLAIGGWGSNSNTGKIQFQIASDKYKTLYSPDPISLGIWNHVVGTWKPGDYMRIYVNGKEVAKSSDTYPDKITINDANAFIGVESNGASAQDSNQNKNFKGIIDNLKIYNYALDGGQITDEFNEIVPMVFDADNDGVPDNSDECSNTPGGVDVDAEGCPLDSDNDGIGDNEDQCEDTPEGVNVDAEGCPLDSDNDGVPDNLEGSFTNGESCVDPDFTNVFVSIEHNLGNPPSYVGYNGWEFLGCPKVDLNLDKGYTVTDFSQWLTIFRDLQNNPNQQIATKADINQDGFVTVTDFSQWLEEFRIKNS